MKKLILYSLFTGLSIFAVQAQTRVVLLEQFTNSSCPPCAQSSPPLYNFANNNTATTAVISYHTAFPYFNDSMHFENMADPNQRVSFYNVGSVPNTVVDGNVYSGSTASLLPSVSTTVGNRAAVSPDYGITAQSFTLTGNQLTGTFYFTSLNASNTADNLVAHLVVIEKDVQKSAYAASPGNNSETHYEFVMRKMLPDANGTTLYNKALNAVDTIPLSWTVANFKDNSQLRVVAFVQNSTSQEVYQAGLFTPQFILGTAENGLTTNQAVIYPNPTTSNFTIALHQAQFVNQVNILNQLGQLVYTQPVNETLQTINVQPELPAGIYYISINSVSGTSFQKINVVK